jgi:hypothetical protein
VVLEANSTLIRLSRSVMFVSPKLVSVGRSMR